MIIDKDIHPEQKIYYFGALMIDQMRSSHIDKIDYFSLFEMLNITTHISIDLFSLTLDWLFILGIIKNESGYIIKCF